MEMIAYLFASFIGLSLGLLGGGGSILTVPILVYILNMPPKTSIALSLAVVGLTSLIGTITHLRAGNVNFKVAFIFAPIAMLGTFLGAKLAVLLTGEIQLIAFAIIMMLASYFMLKEKKDSEESIIDSSFPIIFILLEGFLVGVVTGIVGVGGGFLIVPTLVLLARIPMKQAIGTSLFIIALNSFSGFVGYLGTVEIPWKFLGKFTIFTSIGIVIGTKLTSLVPQKQLKKLFGLFLIIMAIIILYKNRTVFF